MSFRERQKFVSCGAAEVKEQLYSINPDNGVAELKEFSYSSKLPDPSMTDLGLQLKAGVPLQSVDTKVVKGSKEKQALAVLSVEEVPAENKEA